MMSSRLLLCLSLLSSLLVLPGCFDTPKPECAFACGEGSACPDGYRCAGDGWCKRDDVAEDYQCSTVSLIDADVDADPMTPDGAVPDADLTPDADVPDASAIDGGLPDADLPDAALPDAALPDAALPDAAPPDAAPPDAALPDAAPPDAALPDASLPDAA